MEEAVVRYLSNGNGGGSVGGGGGGLEKLTVMPLEGEGKVEDRVDRLFKEYLSRPEWVEDLRCADAVFVATHSQGEFRRIFLFLSFPRAPQSSL